MLPCCQNCPCPGDFRSSTVHGVRAPGAGRGRPKAPRREKHSCDTTTRRQDTSRYVKRHTPGDTSVTRQTQDVYRRFPSGFHITSLFSTDVSATPNAESQRFQLSSCLDGRCFYWFSLILIGSHWLIASLLSLFYPKYLAISGDGGFQGAFGCWSCQDLLETPISSSFIQFHPVSSSFTYLPV